MAISIIGAVIGAMVLGASFYYFRKEKDDQESRKIYGIIGGIGGLIFIGSIIKLIFDLL